jgi:hypothetical protein
VRSSASSRPPMTSSSYDIFAPTKSSSGSVAVTAPTRPIGWIGLKPRGTSVASILPRKS